MGVAQWLIGSTLLSTHPADTLPNTRRMFIMQATVPFGKQRRRLPLPLPHPYLSPFVDKVLKWQSVQNLQFDDAVRSEEPLCQCVGKL